MDSLLRRLCREREPSIDSSIRNLSLLFSKTDLIRGIKRVKQHYDEPQFHQFSANLNSQYLKSDSRKFSARASGFSFFSRELAFLKCCGESIERYCNHVFFKDLVKFKGPFSNIKKKALDPQAFVSFSSKQKKENLRLKLGKNSIFCWTEGKSLLDERKILIPSQLIYLSYPLIKREPLIRSQISTGAAGGSCLSAAIVRGIYEIVERDSFMIYYLNKIPSPGVDLKNMKDNRVQRLLDVASRYKLRIVVLDITTDLEIPAYVSIVIDKTGIGKAVSVGLKANLNNISAIIGSIEEAFHTRLWMRREHEKRKGKIKKIKLKEISDFIDRGLLWYPNGAIKKLNFWLKNQKTIEVKKAQRNLTSGEQLEQLTDLLKKHSCEAYFAKLMISQLEKLNYFVVKVIIPKLHPLYLKEKHPYLGGERLYEVPKKLGFKTKKESELNKYPHPFL